MSWSVCRTGRLTQGPVERKMAGTEVATVKVGRHGSMWDGGWRLPALPGLLHRPPTPHPSSQEAPCNLITT